MSRARTAGFARSRSKPKRKRKKPDVPKAPLFPPAPEQPIGTELRLTIPTTTRKNTSHRAVPWKKADGSMSAKSILSETTRHFRDYVNILVMEQKLPRTIMHGKWGVEIVAYWPRMRHLDDEDFPFGDVDAPITQVLDAVCKGAHVFDDDVRLAPLVADRGYDPENPRVEVLFKRWA